jgi:hypothetical protein
VIEKSLRDEANHGLLVLARALTGASGSFALERMQKDRRSGNRLYTVIAGKAKWKFRIKW